MFASSGEALIYMVSHEVPLFAAGLRTRAKSCQSVLTGQTEGSTDKSNPDITAQLKSTGRHQLHLALVAFTGFRIVAGPVNPPFVTFGSEPLHHLKTENRAVPQCRIGIFPVDLYSTDRPIRAVDIFRHLKPDNFSADVLSTLQ